MLSKERILKSCIVAVLCAFVLTQGFATTYYVNDASTSGDTWCDAVGDDTNDGLTISTPYLTLADLLTDIALGDNDVVRIDNGTYSWAAVNMNASGTSGNVITIEGAGQTKTIITSSSGYGLDLNGQDFVTIKNLRWNNASNTTIYIDTPSNDIVMSGCTFDCTAANDGYRALALYNLSTACTVDDCIIMAERNPLQIYHSTNHTISNCTITTVSSTTGVVRMEQTSTGVTLSGNKINGSSGALGLIYCSSGGTYTNGDFYNNILDGNTCAAGLFLDGTADALDIYNNYVYDVGDGINSNSLNNDNNNIYFNSFYTTINVLKGRMGGWDIRNNSFYTTSNSNGDYCINACCSSDFPTTMNYNSYYHPNDGRAAWMDNDNDGTLADIVAGTAYEDNGIEGDPDYDLSGLYYLNTDNTSPLDGAGIAIAGYTTDLKGLTRTDPPTIGASTEGAVLPIELASFDAHRIDDKVEIIWSTATETNNDHFEIHRSHNGLDWEVIEIVSGNGTTTSVVNYQVLDHNPGPGLVYYRLFDVDYDGLKNSSRVVVVTATADACIAVDVDLVNPTNAVHIRIKGPTRFDFDQGWAFSLYNNQGQLLQHQWWDDLQGEHRISPINSSGIYVVQLSKDNLQCVQKIHVTR